MFTRTTKLYIFLVFAGLVVLTLFPVIGEAQTTQPRPFAGRYQLTMGAPVAANSSVTGLTGSYDLRVELRCDGWLTTEAMDFTMQTATGPLPRTSARSRGWESHDGRGYRYQLTVSRGNQIVEEVDVKALMAGTGQPGKAEFAKPRTRTVDLPPGTMFPHDYMLFLAEQAAIGQNFAGRTVFPGWGPGKPLSYAARMGPPENTPAGQTNGLDAIGAAVYWPMEMVVSDPATGQPLLKQAMTLRADGIAGSYLFDYSTFTMSARLTQVQALPMPTCN
ncbi:MAG: DUF1849 family protein [Rhodospirillales bacterium]